MDLFSGTLKRPKLRPNRTMTEVDRDRTETETETWTEWCAKNRTGPGLPNPSRDLITQDAYEASDQDPTTAIKSVL